MPWFFSIPEFLKKRACRYLLQHYLGQFLEEKISLDDLTVDLYNGTGSIHNIPLNMEAINSAVDSVGLPLRVESGFIECVTVSVPWSALLKESCVVELSGLTLCVAAHRTLRLEEYMSMTDSLFSSMVTSRQMAEEVIRGGGGSGEDQGTGFEGMEALAQAIELVLARVQISLKDTVFQVNHEVGDRCRHFLQLKVGRLEYYDQISKVESSVDGDAAAAAMPAPPDVSVKVLHLSDLSIELGTSLSPPSTDEDELRRESGGVPVAVAGGQITVKVTLRQGDEGHTPRLEVEGSLGLLHVLLSPHQLGLLQDMVEGMAAQASSRVSEFERLPVGQSRPIPHGDRGTLETQLARHQHLQQQRAHTNLLDADPWEATPLKPHPLVQEDSMAASGGDQFYSLDLNSLSGSGTLEDSAMERGVGLGAAAAGLQGVGLGAAAGLQGVHRRSLEGENVPFHDGVGLQQLSQSPPTHQSHAPSGRVGMGQPKLSSSCKYSLTLSGLTLALLEADPAHTYTSSAAGESPPGVPVPGPTHSSSVDEGGLDPVRYFELMCELLKDGLTQHQLDWHHKELAQLLPADHLMVWLSVLRGGVTVVDDVSWECEMSLGCGEVWEYLYHNHTRINHITNPVSVTPVVQLLGNQTVTPPRPGFKLKVKTSPDATRKKSGCGMVESGVEGFVSGLHLNVDLTLLDRMQLLLSRQPNGRQETSKAWSLHAGPSVDHVKHSLYMTASNINTIQMQRQAVFNQAVAPPTSGHSNRWLTVKLSGDTIHTSLRFPVPQCGQTQHPPTPWITSALRHEVLFAELEEWVLSSHLHPQALAGEAPYALHYQFKHLQASLSLDGSVEARQPFLTVSGPLSQHSTTNLPTIVLEVRPDSGSSLEQKGTGQQDRQPQLLNLLEDSLMDRKPKPQPFSQKRSMFSAGGRDNQQGRGGGAEETAQGEDIHSEEFVFPGSVSEMKEFADSASSSAQYHLNCSFPEVRVHLPSKHFLETLYNRFGTDLVLWEPATPTAVSKASAQSIMYSCMDLLQPAATSHDRFLMCKSVLKEEDEEEEEEEEEDPDSYRQEVGGAEGCGLSYLAISLEIEGGLISMLPEGVVSSEGPAPPEGVSGGGAEESELFESARLEQLVELSPPEDSPPNNSPGSTPHRALLRGVAVLEVSEVKVFLVCGVEGEENHDCLCAWAQDMALYHHGNLGDNAADYSCLNKTFDLSSCTTLLPVFGPSPLIRQPLPQPLPMLSLAMETSLDQQHSTKTSKLAVCVSDGALFYRVWPAGLGPIHQLASFLELQEEVISGYERPAVVTELHAHLNHCSLEYQPLYLPVVGTVVLDSISVSTSVVSGAPVHVVRVVLDGLHLLLTPRPSPQTPPTGRREGPPQAPPREGGSGHSVCVLDMEWFELTLKHCNNALLSNDFQQLFAKMPDISLECASNLLHFRLCRDSCTALCDLLLYLSSQRDLAPPPQHQHLPPVVVSIPSSKTPGSQPSLPSSKTQPSSKGSQLAEGGGGGESGDIGDLISDAMEDASPTSPRGGVAKGGHTQFPVPAGRKAVRVSGGDALLMEFDSDSEEEEERREAAHGTPAPTLAVNRKMVDSLFSDSEEDDFCIVTTPTSTRVAPGAQPKVKSLLKEGDELEIVEDHFSLPDGQMDQLRAPSSYPSPITQYTLKEMSVVWHLYGGLDFPAQGEGGRGREGRTEEKRRRRPSALRCWTARRDAILFGNSWKSGGGVARDHSVLVEVELDQVRMQQETYPSSCVQSSRLVVLVGDVEIRDRLADSHINKLLYQYTTESMPKQAHASMVTLKVLFTQPEMHSQQKLEEASVYLSVLPIRLNMDQDTVLFLYEFASHVGSYTQLPPSDLNPPRSDTKPASSEGCGQPLPPAAGSGGGVSSTEVFIKSFLFQPELPVRIDYEAKGFKTEMGTMAGILFGLSHLSNSELSLKALHYKKGLLGWSELMRYCSSEWVTDIRNYQLPLLLKGVGPMHNVTQLVYGVLDFVRLPYQQYQEDGRLVWGIQRGTSALTSSTGVAVVELTSQLLETIQGLAQMAYDMVSPSEGASQPLHHHHKPYQPLDFREGFSNAYDVVYAGIGGTAVDLYDVASREHSERGVAGAVGGVLRHLPGTFVKPIILVSEATRHVLGGVKNQFVPDARREAHEKWKSNQQEEENHRLN